MLQKVARIIRTFCRAEDIVARFGGDEFVMLLPNTSPSEAERVQERINEAIGKEEINGIRLSVSFGRWTKLDENENIEEVAKNAENKMYKNITEKFNSDDVIISAVLLRDFLYSL